MYFPIALHILKYFFLNEKELESSAKVYLE